MTISKTDILIIYLIISSTIGAYHMAVNDARTKNEDITLLHVLGNILPGIILFIPFLLIELCTKIIIKKRK